MPEIVEETIPEEMTYPVEQAVAHGRYRTAFDLLKSVFEPSEDEEPA